jgi:hypothetical protein
MTGPVPATRISLTQQVADLTARVAELEQALADAEADTRTLARQVEALTGIQIITRPSGLRSAVLTEGT